MNIRRTAACALIALCFSPGLQARDREERSWDNLRRLKAGQKVRVVRISTESTRGHFLRFIGEAITLRVKDREVTIPRVEVARVTTPFWQKRLRNTLIGMGGGAGIGAAVVVPQIGSVSDETFIAHLLTGVIIFAAGTVAGAVIPANRTIYRLQ